MSNEKAYKQLPLLHLQGLYGNIHINYIISSETANFFKVQNKICICEWRKTLWSSEYLPGFMISLSQKNVFWLLLNIPAVSPHVPLKALEPTFLIKCPEITSKTPALRRPEQIQKISRRFIHRPIPQWRRWWFLWVFLGVDTIQNYVVCEDL